MSGYILRVDTTPAEVAAGVSFHLGSLVQVGPPGAPGATGAAGANALTPIYHEASSFYYGVGRGNGINGAPSFEFLNFQPWIVATTIQIDRVGINVTTGGGSGSVMRFGLYSDDANFFPNARITDWGTVTTELTGLREVSFAPQTITPGLYWLASVAQVGTAPQYTRAAGNEFIGDANGANPFLATQNGYLRSGTVAGALPDPWGTFAGVLTSAPRIVVRVV